MSTRCSTTGCRPVSQQPQPQPQPDSPRRRYSSQRSQHTQARKQRRRVSMHRPQWIVLCAPVEPPFCPSRRYRGAISDPTADEEVSTLFLPAPASPAPDPAAVTEVEADEPASSSPAAPVRAPRDDRFERHLIVKDSATLASFRVTGFAHENEAMRHVGGIDTGVPCSRESDSRSWAPRART